jgi:peptidoglycan hydrolase-like protein with peptidoglycan-binding domain
MGTSIVRLLAACLLAALLVAATPGFAAAYEFTRRLEPGSTGPDVRALNMRVAGWYPNDSQRRFWITAEYGPRTEKAVAAFEEFHGLRADGVAGTKVFDLLNTLEQKDGSTLHFEYSEFVQKSNSGCSAKANAYAGTFAGGMAAPKQIKRNVKRLMWRLEALRAKGGDGPIGINSGFRSVAYNKCIDGAAASQHLYGTAADNRVAGITNRRSRDLARASQFGGIGCYSSTSHNHFDLRIENRDLPSSRFWWWPSQDRKGRDLDYAGRPCWGEKGTASHETSNLDGNTISAVLRGVPGVGSPTPTPAEVAAFQAAGEVANLKGAD